MIPKYWAGPVPSEDDFGVSVDLSRIPSDYTGCEVYRGYVIACKDGSYAAFNTERRGMFIYLKGGFGARCLARAAIDLEFA